MRACIFCEVKAESREHIFADWINELIAATEFDAPSATRYMRGLGEVRRDGAPLTDLYTHTIQVAHLVPSVRGVTTLPASDNRSLESIAEPRHYEIPLFPPAEVCRWPPGLVMDEKALIEYSGGNNLGPSAD